MRLLLSFRAIHNQIHDPYYHYKTQAFLYSLIRDTEFDTIHDSHPTKQTATPFCFSNIFPHRDMKDGDKKSLLISSPSSKLINVMADSLKQRKVVGIGNMEFVLDNVKKFNLQLKPPYRFITSTPTIIRVHKSVYTQFETETKHPYEYVFWRKDHALEMFLKQAELNLKTKFEKFYGKETKNLLKFTKFIFKKELPIKIQMKDQKTFTVFASFWEFWFEEENELIKFGLDAGFGERNRLGFGFLNPS